MNNVISEKLKTLPKTSGVYIMKDISGNVIYVGKAKNLKRRVTSYFIGNDKPIKTFNLTQNIQDFEYILTSSDTDAFLLENNLIKKYQPHFNILLKDGKNYPYLKIDTKEDFPKLEVTRKVKNDSAKYFGPYFNGISTDQILKIVARAFNLRTCNISKFGGVPKKPCLNYSLGLCNAPCANYVTKQKYKEQVDDVILFLKGNTKQVEEILMQKMEIASNTQNFEKAIEIREEIKSLNHLKQHFTAQFSTLFDQDVVGFYTTGTNAVISVMIIRGGKQMAIESFTLTDLHSFATICSTFLMQYYSGNRTIPKKIVLQEQIDDQKSMEQFLCQKSGHNVEIIVSQKGKNKKLCELTSQNAKEYLEKSLGIIKMRELKTYGAIKRLKEILALKSIPYRMECYDISNISGTNSVASMVVFINGEMVKTQYRKFNIKTVEQPDDFASLAETLKRRLAELNSQDESFSSMPNLIVIDGGKGQLTSVENILQDFQQHIDLCSLAKQDEEIYIPNVNQPIRLKKSDIALQILQRIRDEAHRFAITFHRSKRNNAMTKSVLDNVKGIGKTKKLLLFEKFGSLDNMSKSSIEELQLVKGVTESQAIEIKNILNKQK